MKYKKYIPVFLCMILVFAGFFIYKHQSNQTLRIPQTGFKEYHSRAYHFSIFYPENLSVTEYKEGGNAETITFEETKGDKGFQIFILPYGEQQITQERFKMDVPSGVREEPVDIMIDGIRGNMFFSTNSLMGETREVWFIKGGFLYEVTTYKELDAWISGIMQSWKFI